MLGEVKSQVHSDLVQVIMNQQNLVWKEEDQDQLLMFPGNFPNCFGKKKKTKDGFAQQE